MTRNKRVFVLVGDEQTPLSPSDVAGEVIGGGWYQASERYGYSVSTLRGFLAENNVFLKRTVNYEKAGGPVEEYSIGG